MTSFNMKMRQRTQINFIQYLKTITGIKPFKAQLFNYYILPYRPNLPFLISDIRALWRSALSARVPKCQKLKMVG